MSAVSVIRAAIKSNLIKQQGCDLHPLCCDECDDQYFIDCAISLDDLAEAVAKAISDSNPN